MKITVLSASIRNGRKSHGIALHVFETLQNKPGMQTLLIDLKNYPLPLMESRMDRSDQLPEGLQAFSDSLTEADGIIIVAPEYKNGMPGALKNAFDYLNPHILKHIPVGVVTVSSGGFGGINCLSQTRLTVLALGGLPIPEKLCVSDVNEIVGEEASADTKNSFSANAEAFVDDFLWYAERLA